MRKKTTVWLMIAASLILIGCIVFGGVMAVLKWDFTKLSTVSYETNKHEIHEDFKNISVVTDTANVIFVSSENAETAVVCHEQKNAIHSVTVHEDMLTIKVNDTRKWYEHIGITFGTPKITVYLPEGEYGTLSVTASTGDIHVENISAGDVYLSVSTGKVTAADLTCRGDLKINVSTGKTNLTDISCKNFVSDGNTGRMTLKNVIATESLSIERSTGDVTFDHCDATEISVTTSTGNVKGSLLSGKVFIAQTSTGHVDVPSASTGGRCQISTGTGDIKISIEQ